MDSSQPTESTESDTQDGHDNDEPDGDTQGVDDATDDSSVSTSQGQSGHESETDTETGTKQSQTQQQTKSTTGGSQGSQRTQPSPQVQIQPQTEDSKQTTQQSPASETSSSPSSSPSQTTASNRPETAAATRSAPHESSSDTAEDTHTDTAEDETVREAIETVVTQLGDELDGTQWDRELIGEQVTKQLAHNVPPEQATQAVIHNIARQLGIDRSRDSTEQTVTISDLTEPENWVTLTARVSREWPNETDSIKQVGLLADGTGTVKFTLWDKADIDPLEIGTQYRFAGVVTDTYEGRISIKINSYSEVTPDDTDLGERSPRETTGFVVELYYTGATKRCPESDCPFRITHGVCPTHDNVPSPEQTHEFRLIIDDGTDPTSVIVTKPQIEALLEQELSLDTLIAAQTTDDGAAQEASLSLKTQLIGQPLTVTGPSPGGTLIATSFARPRYSSVEEVIQRAQK